MIDIYLMIRISAILTGLTVLYKGIKHFKVNRIYAKMQIGFSIVCFLLAVII